MKRILLPSGDLPFQVLRFARRLRDKGLAVTLGRTAGAIAGLDLIRLEEKEELFVLLSAHFVSRPEDLPVFEQLFAEFWESGDRAERGEPLPGLPRALELAGGEDSRPGSPRSARDVQYSYQESLRTKDFGDLSGPEAEEINRAILGLARDLGLQLSRRYRSASRGGRVDFPGSLRRSLRHGGELLILRRKKRRLKKHRFVVVSDVSGSMDQYSRFLLRFLYGFQKKIPRVETFVFSTRLSRITDLLRLRDMTSAYDLIAGKVKDWSGGTRIGSSLQEYNRRYGGRYSTPRTIFILMSDGWDQGEIDLLDRELKALKRRVRELIWLNPLLGLPDYQPLDRGMSAALPYTDHFLDCHDLEHLEEFGRTLKSVCQT
jgi:uncharacterized protein with von Willebrand factor type A (vWA) domain